MNVDPTDLIWMNGDFVAWEDAKVHVLTHGLHYGTGVFEGMRCYDTELGPAVFRNAEHVERLLRSAELYYMPVPYSAEELRSATLELVARNGLRSCYIRPIVFRGYGEMGLNPLRGAGRCDDRLLGVGRLPRRGGQAQRHPREGLLVASGSARDSLIPHAKASGPVPEQRARQGRVAEGRLRGGDPARRPRPRVRGHGREPLHRARRRDRDAGPAQLDPRRHHPPLDHPDRRRPRLRRSSSATSPARSCTSPTRCSCPAPPPSSCRCARSTTTRSATGEPGEITRVLQAAFDDAIHGRSERYREWLDVVAAAPSDPHGRGARARARRRPPRARPAWPTYSYTTPPCATAWAAAA